MANMSYCRFQNTSSDLLDCLENWDDEDLSVEEIAARKRLLSTCQEIIWNFGEDDDDVS